MHAKTCFLLSGGLAILLGLGFGFVGTGCAEDPGADNPELGSWVAGLEGRWFGADNETPVGPLDFGLEFVPAADGGMFARAEQDEQTWFEFRFYQNTDGALLLQEEGAFGGFVQSHELSIAETRGDRVTWTTADPGFLTVHTALSEQQLVIEAVVRSQPHARLVLDRVQ